MKILRLIWSVLISLKLAVLVLSSLTLSLIAATTMESIYDTPTAQYWVYQTVWFYGVLGLLGLNILCVALSRLPWQKKHLPFLTAHLGILILLYGSWVTNKFGVDGSLQVNEGTTGSMVEINEPILVIADANVAHTVPVKWVPPNATFNPIHIPDYGLRVEEQISHADPQIRFIPARDSQNPKKSAALQLKIAGGPKAPPFMRAGQEFWLWQADPSWSIVKIGAAEAYFSRDIDPVLPKGSPSVGFRFEPGSKELKYWIKTSEGKMTRGSLNVSDPKSIQGKVLETGWKFDATITIQEFIPAAESEVKYVPSQVQYGNNAPPAAIRIRAVESKSSENEVWLGLGERATLFTQGKTITIAYYPKRLSLPFGIELKKFEIARYPGSENPMEFSSLVRVQGGVRGEPAPTEDVLISMNEPLKHGGYVFYQSSYVDARPRPTISIFSVNQDPGRWLKYLGSILITMGSIWLFVNRYRLKKTPGTMT